MANLILTNQAGQRLSIGRTIVTGLAWALLVALLAGCRLGSEDAEAVAAIETQAPVVAALPPSATLKPPATATPIPPTATMAPSPTPAPTKAPTPEVVTIPYMDLETERNPAAMPQWLKIYRPAGVTAPYPTIFLLPDLVFTEATDYRGVVKEFLARGYAVVLVKYQDKAALEGDLYLQESELTANLGWESCALAWTAAYGGDYDLDLDRLVIFSTAAEGTSAASMPLYDEAMWAETLVECRYPVPTSDAVKAVVTFDAVLGIPDSNLQRFPGKWAESLGISLPEMEGMIEALNTASPQDWHKPGVLDGATHNKLARTLPLYWVYKTSAEGPVVPAYLLIYDRGVKDIFDYVAEAEGMADHMRVAGVDVTLRVLQDTNGWELVDPSTGVAPRVVEAADAYISQLLQ